MPSAKFKCPQLCSGLFLAACHTLHCILLQGLGWPSKCEVVCVSCDDILRPSPCRADDKPKDIFGIREGGADAAPQESGVGSSATEMDMS